MIGERLNQACGNRRGRSRHANAGGPQRGGTACRPPSDGSHGVACPAFARTVPKGTNQTPGRVCKRRLGRRLNHSRPKGREVLSPTGRGMPGLGIPADKRLRLCRCPKGDAASREGSGINASGDAEAKASAVKGERRKNRQIWSQISDIRNQWLDKVSMHWRRKKSLILADCKHNFNLQ